MTLNFIPCADCARRAKLRLASKADSDASKSASSFSLTRLLLTVSEVAELLSFSTRHVRRLSEKGRMPSPLHLGASVRWSRVTIETWIAAGCPSTKGGSR
jgi:excisionase family DNA binding protein